MQEGPKKPPYLDDTIPHPDDFIKELLRRNSIESFEDDAVLDELSRQASDEENLSTSDKFCIDSAKNKDWGPVLESFQRTSTPAITRILTEAFFSDSDIHGKLRRPAPQRPILQRNYQLVPPAFTQTHFRPINHGKRLRSEPTIPISTQGQRPDSITDHLNALSMKDKSPKETVLKKRKITNT